VLPAVAFLLLGVVILVPSLQIYAQMRRLHMTGTGPALASVILSLAIVIGSIVRLWFLR